MTVEFAVVLPAVALVLVGLVAAVLVVDGLGRVQLAASAAARSFGRGDDAAARAAVDRIAPGAAVSVRRSDGLVCVEATRPGRGPFAAVPVRASGCALDDGR